MLNELAQTLRDRMLLLRSLPAFAPMDDEALTLLAEYVHVHRFRADEVLMTLGEPIRHVYVVLDGAVRWRRKDRPSMLAEKQQVVGWLTLMARDANGLEAVADRDTITLELPAEILEHAMEQHFSIVRNMLKLGAGLLVSMRNDLPAPLDRPPSSDKGVLPTQRRTLVERLIDMRRVPLFSRCNAEALIALARASEPLRVEPGTVFWSIGDSANFWIFIEYGRVLCRNARGDSMAIGANFGIGIMDAIAQAPRAFSARAETLVVGNRIDLEAFLGVMESHFDLARDYLALLAQSGLDGA